MKNYICFDIGGTSIKFGVLKENGEIIFKDSVDTEARTKGGKGILEKLVTITNKYKDEYSLSGVAISCAGMIDSKNGVIMYTDEHLIPGFTGMRIKEEVEKQTSIKCELENDVNCAGLGEFWLGSGANSKYVSMLTVGTGIGSCLIEDGRLLTGDTMCAGEVGKIMIPGGRFEDIASSYAMTSALEKKLGLEKESLNGKMVFDEIEKGNQVYIDAVDEMINNLAIGISNLCFIFNPGVIILGGGIMERQDYFAPRLSEAMRKYLPDVIFNGTEIRFAKLKNDAGMIGALRYFLNVNN